MITVDEIIYAGRAKTWLAYNSLNTTVLNGTNFEYWWTMSPMYDTGNASVYRASTGNTAFTSQLTNNGAYIRPVLSLKSCVKWKSGNGSSSNPYEVEISSTCASLEN